jgi:2-polyprenyl-6-methoxyphenol hydroxylase-like FAD-dependent oxidoreductase
METDVLIVGAGPTGLMLANQLVRRGIRVRIIDRHAGPAEQTRAMAVHARTLEIYSQLGLAERAISLGRIGYGANMWANGERKARIPLADIGANESPFPYVLMLGQDDNEKILGEALNDAGTLVEWRTELVGLQQHSERVTATLSMPDGSRREVSAGYVAGCDGSRSAVRELNGIGFPGAPYEQVFFVADTEATGSMIEDELNVFLWRKGFHLFFPMRDENGWRVIGILPKELQDVEGLTFERLEPSLVREVGAGLAFKRCHWFSTYRISHRCTETFAKGRCFLLGDAAHVHSPMGGQGMNTGLQDAYNLAWKLAWVIQGRAKPELLDSFEPERHAVAKRLLETTDRAFQVVVADHWAAAIFRTRILAKIAAFNMSMPRVRKLIFNAISQIGISYRESPLSRTLAGVGKHAPQAGDRFPWMHLALEDRTQSEDLYQRLDDMRFNLLLIGQDAEQATELGADDRLAVHRVKLAGANREELAKRGITSPAYYLLRPDGHVALAGGRFEAAALDRWFKDSGVYTSTNSVNGRGHADDARVSAPFAIRWLRAGRG